LSFRLISDGKGIARESGGLVFNHSKNISVTFPFQATQIHGVIPCVKVLLYQLTILGQLPAVYLLRQSLLFVQSLPRMQSRFFVRLVRRLAAVLIALSEEPGGFCTMHGSLSVIDCNLGNTIYQTLII